MARSTDETRRSFLIRLAKASALVPPTILTYSGHLTASQGGKGGGKGGGPPGISGGSSSFITADGGGLSAPARGESASRAPWVGTRLPPDRTAPWQKKPEPSSRKRSTRSGKD